MMWTKSRQGMSTGFNAACHTEEAPGDGEVRWLGTMFGQAKLYIVKCSITSTLSYTYKDNMLRPTVNKRR